MLSGLLAQMLHVLTRSGGHTSYHQAGILATDSQHTGAEQSHKSGLFLSIQCVSAAPIPEPDNQMTQDQELSENIDVKIMYSMYEYSTIADEDGPPVARRGTRFLCTRAGNGLPTLNTPTRPHAPRNTSSLTITTRALLQTRESHRE